MSIPVINVLLMQILRVNCNNELAGSTYSTEKHASLWFIVKSSGSFNGINQCSQQAKCTGQIKPNRAGNNATAMGINCLKPN